MLRKIASSWHRLPNKQQAAASFFCTSAVSPLKYTIREATEDDYLGITRLRAEELWGIPLSEQEEINDWWHALLTAGKSPGFHVIVAAKEPAIKASEIYGAVDLLVSKNAMLDVHGGKGPDEPAIKQASEIYGAVDLLVSKNAMLDVHAGRVPDEWKSDEGKQEDAYLTDLAVASFARRQHIAVNLLKYAREVAVSKNMKRLFAEVHEGNQAALSLNQKLGYQFLSFNDRSKLYLMGMKLR